MVKITYEGQDLTDAYKVVRGFEPGGHLHYSTGIPKVLHYKAFDLKRIVSKAKHLELLDEMTPLERASYGPEDWNDWVHWAQLKDERWLSLEVNGDFLQVSFKENVDCIEDKKCFSDRGISFHKGQDWHALEGHKAEWGVPYIIDEKIDFSGFIFPCPVSFRNATFTKQVNFSNCEFVALADFREATFNEGAIFHSANFRETADFIGIDMRNSCNLKKTLFSGNMKASSSQFHSTLDLRRTSFKKDVSFVSAYFHHDLICSHFSGSVDMRNITVCGDAIINHAVFEGDAKFSCAEFKKLADFSGELTHFHGEADFTATRFYGKALFKEATFDKEAKFGRIVFLGDAMFDGCVFHKTYQAFRNLYMTSVSWSDATFEKSAHFWQSQFLNISFFDGAHFGGAVDFDHVWFGKTSNTPKPAEYSDWGEYIQDVYDKAAKVTHKSITVPDFTRTFFELLPNLGYTRVEPIPKPKALIPFPLNLGVDRHVAWRISDRNAASKLRRLQELAGKGHNNLAEKRFFRAELLARRGHEAKTWRENTMIDLFELFSGCGLSFWRPIAWLLIFWLPIFMVAYGCFADPPISGTQDIWPLFQFSAANSLPFLGLFKGIDSESVRYLFGSADNIPYWVSVTHNLISTLYIFFALLAVRNYFKLG